MRHMSLPPAHRTSTIGHLSTPRPIIISIGHMFFLLDAHPPPLRPCTSMHKSPRTLRPNRNFQVPLSASDARNAISSASLGLPDHHEHEHKLCNVCMYNVPYSMQFRIKGPDPCPARPNVTAKPKFQTKPKRRTHVAHARPEIRVPPATSVHVLCRSPTRLSSRAKITTARCLARR